ncbi:ImmA/IrrE family metallo-endopeptidase [Sphaerotilus sp.]|uniref:ImmA/IrrE family metallo-endopeptidase n=1 Tax=Sphaerotilus sp. TaxID=2093942 RepID=UPI002ACDD259|nr:ImmA/IrrE family metallo-endopeptidase [Sphaerotilus sp.]MDZ7856824.1 ImmA/IrrE family metallo-endopeptidase [Sphaerotilus sp.]
MTELAATDTDTGAPFTPDWVSPPGDTILDLIEERDWTQQQLAARLGYTAKHVSHLINGKVPLTEEAAIRLQHVLEVPVGFWLQREARYRERAALLEATNQHATMVGWLDNFPLREMMRLNVLPKRRIDAKSKPSLVAEVLTFFGVASAQQWQSNYGCMELSFRRSRPDQSDIGAISAWLRMGERTAEKLDGPRYDEGRFRSALQAIRPLTTQAPQEFEPQLRQLLHAAGVVLVLIPALPRAHVAGVARWLNPHRPLIQLSLYGKTNDKFWFTFFHEAAHVLLHSQEKKAVFLDDPGTAGSNSVEEQQANAWARDFLIPPEHAEALHSLPKSKAAVTGFANRIGIHPGIVVGRLQFDGHLDMTWMNDLKVSFAFTPPAEPRS